MGLQFPLSFGRQNISKSWHLLDTQVLVWPATAGQVSVAGPPLWLSTGMGPSSAVMESTLPMASARRRGPLRPSLRLRPTMAMEDMEGMALAMEATAMGVLDTVMARGLLTQRRMLTTVMVDMDLDMADTAMGVLVTAMVDMGTPRGLPTLRPMLTSAMEDMALAMEATAMVVLAMVMARGLLTLRLTHTTAMEDMVDMDLAMEATVMARGRLMPSLTMVDTVGPTLVLDTATAAMVALSVDTATWDKECQRL